MDIKELEKLVKLCRKYGIETLKTAQVELKVDLGHSGQPRGSNEPISEPSAPDKPAYTDEDVLLWSSGPTLPE